MFLLPYRHVLNRSRALIARRLHVSHTSAPALSLPIPPALFELKNKGEIAGAREWLNAFRNSTVPRNLVELSFARSSGPGGQVRVSPPNPLQRPTCRPLKFDGPQNVNKVNTKATARCQVDAKWIPPWALPELRKSVSET